MKRYGILLSIVLMPACVLQAFTIDNKSGKVIVIEGIFYPQGSEIIPKPLMMAEVNPLQEMPEPIFDGALGVFKNNQQREVNSREFTKPNVITNETLKLYGFSVQDLDAPSTFKKFYFSDKYPKLTYEQLASPSIVFEIRHNFLHHFLVVLQAPQSSSTSSSSSSSSSSPSSSSSVSSTERKVERSLEERVASLEKDVADLKSKAR